MELDGRWAITDNWFLNGSVGLLDFNFDDFKNGQCNQGQAPTYSRTESCRRRIPTTLTAANATTRARRTSTWRTGRARWALTMSTRSAMHLLFRSGLDIQFTDNYNPSQNLDPRVEQDAYAQFNLRVAIADADGRWEVALLGRNLTDEEVVSYANDTPLAFSQFGSPTFYGFVDRPRSVALQATYKFGD